MGSGPFGESYMPNLLMHQADAYVPRFKVENTLRFRRPFMLGERFHLASQTSVSRVANFDLASTTLCLCVAFAH